ncbi:MAG TPA: hypothetical protein VHO06_09105 [Polyangia bacterium]|nr:hypothetical protein [Polyangia bacterium]
MSHRKLMFGLTLSAAVGFGAAYVPSLVVHAQGKPAAAPAAPTNCKLHGKKCCDPATEAHLAKEAVFRACGQSDATYLGEDGGEKETCKYFFKIAGAKEDETYVQVYAPAQKEVLSAPNDPFFSYKKVGKAFLADKAKSPKSAPMLAAQTGLYMPGKGYSVTVNASTKVCTKDQAKKLAPAMK